MIPIVTPAEMAAVDAAAPEPLGVLVERAGSSVAWAARKMLGGCYGRHVAVVAGPGNNGADGRVAARMLRRWGAKVVEFDPRNAPERLPRVDLVIDAAFGTGLTRPYVAPLTDDPVLAVDIPSGVSGLTGEVLGAPMQATRTITFQALKPGLLLPPGIEFAGEVEVADIGLELGPRRTHLIERDDVVAWMPERPVDAHKWRSACWVVAGSVGMTGAAELTAAAAARAGSGYVRLSVPGVPGVGPIEAVKHTMPAKGWGGDLGGDVDRFGALVIGPGLGRSPWAAACVRETVAVCPIGLVIDGDGLSALTGQLDLLHDHPVTPVLTPHDGEFRQLAGESPSLDRLEAARTLAEKTHSVVLLKGAATVVASPGGEVLVSISGDARLATAGSGDILSGIIGALIAQKVDPFRAAAMGAWLHGQAGMRASHHAMVASDLLETLPEVIDATHLG